MPTFAREIYLLADSKVDALPQWEYQQLREEAHHLMDGLTLLQIKWLLLRQTSADDEAACVSLDVPRPTLHYWMQNKVFKQTLTMMQNGDGYQLGKIIYQQMLPYAALKNFEMLDAHKPNGEPDWSTVGRGVELAQKGSGLVQDRDIAQAGTFANVLGKLYEIVDRKMNNGELIEGETRLLNE